MKVKTKVIMEDYLESIKNLSGGSRDCYFYYVVPDELKAQVAEYFKDDTWLNFIKLNTFRDRLAYRRVMCRFDDKSDDDHDQVESDQSHADQSQEESEDILDKYLDPLRFVVPLWKERLLIVLLIVLILKLTFKFF